MGNNTIAPTNPHPTCDQSYRAAVAEHRPVGDVGRGDPAMDVVGRNMKLYRSAAGRAAGDDGARIIVYPEWGLFGTSNPASSREAMVPFAQPVGEAGDDILGPSKSLANTVQDEEGNGENGGSNDDRYSVVCELASIAKDCGIVVVANVCEGVAGTDAADDDGGGTVTKLYNTEVAISEDGVLLAKYRKSHPWYTGTFDTPETAEAVTFRTSFGVTFGILICKDFYHAEPQRSLLRDGGGVTQIAYSVAAPDAWGLVRWNYGRWARRNGTTLLASNLGGAGSGIFAGGGDCGVGDVARRDGYTVATIHP